MAVTTGTTRPPGDAGQLNDEALRAKQVRQAEELLFSGPSTVGSPRPCSRGKFRGGAIFPYPDLTGSRNGDGRAGRRGGQGVRRHDIDAAAIDRQADIPAHGDRGAGRARGPRHEALTVSRGSRLLQQGYCRIMEVIGGHYAATAVFVNAHHSIGLRALILFDTPKQKLRWLPPARQRWKLAAFALTEEQAGSDARNVQTTARPTRTARPIS